MKSTTEQLVEEFISCTLPKEKWTHHAHLRVGLWYLLHYSTVESINKLRLKIKQYNVACGIENTETQGYSETITRFDLCLIDRFIQKKDRSQPIDISANKLISLYGKRTLLFKYYSRDILNSKTVIFQ